MSLQIKNEKRWNTHQNKHKHENISGNDVGNEYKHCFIQSEFNSFMSKFSRPKSVPIDSRSSMVTDHVFNCAPCGEKIYFLYMYTLLQ